MSRRGFSHPLSKIVPQGRSSEERVLQLYHLLRAGYTEHRDEMFMAHLRLGFTKVAFFAGREANREKVEEFVSVMCVSLWEGIQRLIDGAIVHHKTPNPTGYLMLKLKGDLRDFSYFDRVIPSHPKQKKHAGRLPLSDETVGRSYFRPRLEAEELMRIACQSERDQFIVNQTLSGETDTAIGLSLNISKMRVGQIKKEMASRIKDYL